MGRDNHPKVRQDRKLDRKKANRASHDRILIITEGKKTDPYYFEEIQAFYRLPSANIQVCFSQLGTSPKQVVEYARQLFTDGDYHKGIRPKLNVLKI